MEFYFSDIEIQDLFNFIQLKGGRFIPDILFESEEYKIISDYNDFFYYQKNETTHFFLIDDKFFFEPLVVSKNRFSNESKKYYVNQRKGGPYIDFSFYRGYSDESSILYKASVMNIYSKFIHFDSSNEFKATTELKEYYNDITKFIKSRSKRVKKNNENYWISTEVLKELIF